MINFGKYIPADDAWVLNNTALPKNTSVESEVIGIGEGGQNAAIELVVEADADLTLNNAKKLTLTVLTSADGSEWKELATGTVTGPSTNTVAAGQLWDFVFPPATLRDCKLKVTTDDASAAGNVNAYLRWIAR